MTAFDFVQVAIFVAAVFAIAPPLGAYVARVLDPHPVETPRPQMLVGGQLESEPSRESHWLLSAVLRPLALLERGIYRAAGADPRREMRWTEYAGATLIFNGLGLLIVFAIQVSQAALPFNPQGLGSISWHSALNTAVSFVTNTNWQGYAGESTMSYLVQAAGLAVQNFLSAATGVAVFLALARALSRRPERTVGNFWADIVRTTVYVLLPLSILLALALVAQGVVQTFAPYVEAMTLNGGGQTIPLGPAASQIAIKQIGTNGGGFFNANSAHPFENPTPFSNFLQALAILALPAALPFAYGKIVGRRRHAWTIFVSMAAVWLASLAGSIAAEYSFNPTMQAAASMEGKEVRIGVVNSLIWSTATTAASNGSVNAMHSSLSPGAGGIALFNIMLGEVIFGGVGSGMYGILLFALLAVFLAGLMVGRSPEYLGKKVEAPEIKMAILGILGPCAVILVGAAISCRLPAAVAGLSHKGPHGLSEILYAWTSAAGNNGSAFAGLNANSVYWNLALAFAMLAGRVIVIFPALAIAGTMAGKKIAPESSGTLRADGFAFAILLVGVILIVGALTFVPALALGPIVEHFLMSAGRAF